jgi:hypothetical protein
MKKRLYIATVESNSTTGRVILAADLEKKEDYKKWVIVALLPCGTEIETGVETMTNGNLEDAVKLVEKAWGNKVCDLQWMQDEDLFEYVEDENE